MPHSGALVISSLARTVASDEWGWEERLLIGASIGAGAALLLSMVIFVVVDERSVSVEEVWEIVYELGAAALLVAFVGAIGTVQHAAGAPAANSDAFVGLLAGTAGVGIVLVGCALLCRSLEMPWILPGYMVVVVVVTAVLAVLGAMGVTHLSLIETVAWAQVGVGAVPLAVVAVVFGVFLIEGERSRGGH